MSLLREDVLTLSAAARRFPGHRANTRMNPSAIWRWIITGAKSLDGRVVKLEAFRAGSRWLTTVQALERFVDALSTVVTPATAPRTPAARSKASTAAGKRLEEMGA